MCLWLMEWYTWEMPECPWSSCVMVSEPSSWMMLFFKPQEIDVQCVIRQCLRFVWRVSTSTRSHEWLSSKAPNTSLWANWSDNSKQSAKFTKSKFLPRETCLVGFHQWTQSSGPVPWVRPSCHGAMAGNPWEMFPWDQGGKPTHEKWKRLNCTTLRIAALPQLSYSVFNNVNFMPRWYEELRNL